LSVNTLRVQTKWCTWHAITSVEETWSIELTLFHNRWNRFP